jgi:hypothetical protein
MKQPGRRAAGGWGPSVLLLGAGMHSATVPLSRNKHSLRHTLHLFSSSRGSECRRCCHFLRGGSSIPSFWRTSLNINLRRYEWEKKTKIKTAREAES